MMELEGHEVVVEAQVKCEPPPDTRCHVTCQQHQVQIDPQSRKGPWSRHAGDWLGCAAEQLYILVSLMSLPASTHCQQRSVPLSSEEGYLDSQKEREVSKLRMVASGTACPAPLQRC